MIAVLFAAVNSPYKQVPGLDVWDAARDARKYAGPHRVIAHPPCSRWCQLARVNEVRWGARVGDDDGCFASALESVRKHGGVLEHPAFSIAWPTFDLDKPDARGGWKSTRCGGFVCEVYQQHYGHKARKRTWLYAFGVSNLPDLRWGKPLHPPQAWCGNKRGQTIRSLGKREASETPPEFQRALLSIVK